MRNSILFFALAAAMLCGCRGGNGQQQADDVAMPFSQQGQYGQASRDADVAASQEAPDSQVDVQSHRVGRGISEIMLQRTGYTVSYNRQTRTPNWVSWTLTREHTYGDQQRDEERFEEDPDVPAPRATWQDYFNSRYDRGHMCPAGDNKWSQEAMTQSFLMTNICPQNHTLNKEDWNDLEMQCRTWARRYGELTVVCGPLFEDSEPRYIGRNRVRVPTGFFKVVCRMEPQPRAVGFLFRNNGSRQPWRQQAVSVDSVERRTGIDFFNRLPDDVEAGMEAVEDLSGW